ncbi:MAG TPA: glycoside hydrolase family protein [Polyangiaceae bacterium]|jgi:hypothetical protein|nr:glycoside hydrolase family protein [Polyangiaceae bacterium]
MKVLAYSVAAVAVGLSAGAGMAACGSQELDPIKEPSPAGTAGDGASVQLPVDSGGVDDGLPQGTNPLGDAGVPADGNETASPHDSGVAGGSTCKRGIAVNSAPGSAFSPGAGMPGVSWWYDWANTGSGAGAGIEFVPMLWGGGSLNGTIPSTSRFLLGFNEPNFKSQSNLTAAQAAADWPKVQAAAKASGAAIVSPAVNYCGSSSDGSGCSDPSVYDPYTYLKDFFADCPGCEVDYIAVHWYNCDLPSLRAYLEGNLDAGGGLQGFTQFGKPIWLTEFSCDSSHSAADNKAYMQAAVPYLESNPHIFRYSWFSASPIPNAQLANSDGTLTDLGTTYVSLPQSCP